jgi:hypothetical protein
MYSRGGHMYIRGRHMYTVEGVACTVQSRRLQVLYSDVVKFTAGPYQPRQIVQKNKSHVMYSRGCQKIKQRPSHVGTKGAVTSCKAEAATSSTREGWPLLTAETEMNGDSKSTNERVPCYISISYPLITSAEMRK